MLTELDRSDLMDRWNSDLVLINDPNLVPKLDLMICDSSATTEAGVPAMTYVANAGFYPASVNDLQYVQRAANGVFHDRIAFPGIRVSASDMRDGASNTLLFSENLLATTWCAVGRFDGGTLDPSLSPVFGDNRFGATFVWLYYSDPVPPLTVDATPPPIITVTHPPLPPESRMKINGDLLTVSDPVIPETARPSSNHPTGVNAAFADGRVSFLTNALPYYVYQQLMTPHGTKSDMPTRINYVLDDEDYKG